MATPRPRAAPTGAALGRARPAATELAGASRSPLLLEDLRDLALVGVEEVVVDLRPAAQLADVEQAGGVRITLLVEQTAHHGPVALGGEDPLRPVAAQEVDEGLGLGRAVRLVDHCRRVLDQDRLVRPYEVDLLALLLRGDRLVLIGDQYVTLAGG